MTYKLSQPSFVPTLFGRLQLASDPAGSGGQRIRYFPFPEVVALGTLEKLANEPLCNTRHYSRQLSLVPALRAGWSVI